VVFVLKEKEENGIEMKRKCQIGVTLLVSDSITYSGILVEEHGVQYKTYLSRAHTKVKKTSLYIFYSHLNITIESVRVVLLSRFNEEIRVESDFV
jgi:hypothetical protein